MNKEQNLEITHSDAIEIAIDTLQKSLNELKKSALAKLLVNARIMAIEYTIDFLKKQIK